MTKLSDHVRQTFPAFFLGGFIAVAWGVLDAYFRDPIAFAEAAEKFGTEALVVRGILEGSTLAAMFATFMVLGSYPLQLLVDRLCSKRS